MGSGIWHLEEAKKTRSFWYLDEKTTDQEGQERMFYIPNLHLYPVALRSDRTLAVLVRRKKDTVICLYDLNNGRYLGVSAKFREALSISDGVRLFWKEECLIVRTRLCRYYFRYDKDKGDFYEDHRISCKNWSQIIKREGNVQNGEEAWEVSVFNHKDSNEDEGYWSVFCYVEDGFQEYLLPYEDSDELIISCFYTKAAVFKSGGDVRLFDLEEKKEIGYFHCLECVDLFWSDTGKELLIVRNDDYLSILPVSGEEREYLQPENLPINERKRSARVEYNSWTELEGDGISQLLDLGTGVLTADQHTEQFPICVTMAVEKDWGAAYYRAKWQNIVVIFQISTRKQLAYFQTDPIYRLESDRPVFYASEGGEKLVLVSKGRAHVLDMTGFFHELDQADQADSSARDLWTIRDAQTGIPVLPKAVLFRIRDEYIDTMKRWIPEVPNTKIADHLEKYLELLWGNRFSYIPDKKQWELDKLGGLPVYVQNDRYWLVDVEHSMVHVCDARGEWLCHYQSGKPFLAADVAGDTLYLLSKDELELYKYELCFCPANSEDACGTLGEQKGFTGVTNPLEASETDRLSMEPEFAADAGRTFDNNRSDKPKGLFAELSVKLGTLLILLLLVFAIRTSPRKGYVFITFYASEENDVTVEDMSFVALNKGNFRRYTVSGNVDSPECSMLLPSGSYDSYATYDGYALFLQTFTMNGNFYDGDIDIGTMIYRLITFDFYDGDGNPITPENVSVSEDGGETWGDLVWISENIYASAEKNSVNEINYLLCVDGRDPIAISANLAGYRTCSVSVVLDESDADEASYTVAEPNQDRYIMIGLLNMNEFTGQTNVQVDLLTDGKERTEIVSYTGNELYLLEAKEGCYCITFECEGYETVEKLCEIDGDTCFYFVYMNLNKLKEAE
ncbi:MAG: hypothetical protein LUG93_15605 [Lachnospiraceae bacterium]|nr:hypothetical protein [Lachnospiraceae bacterium]